MDQATILELIERRIRVYDKIRMQYAESGHYDMAFAYQERIKAMRSLHDAINV